MAAMFWKEWREQRFKLIAVAIMVLVFHVLRLQNETDTAHVIYDNINAMIYLFFILCGILFGVDVVCVERSRGTLQFVQARPVSSMQVLMPKFLVGALGIVFSISLLYAIFYLFPPPVQGQDRAVVAHVLELVPFVALVWLGVLPSLVVFAVSFLASLMTDSVTKSAVFTIVLLSVAPVFVMAVAAVFSGSGQTLSFAVPMLPFDQRGQIVLAGWAPSVIVQQTLSAGVLIGLTFAVSLDIFRKKRSFVARWRTILISGVGIWLMYPGVSILMSLTLWGKSSRADASLGMPPMDPVGVIALESVARDVSKDGNAAFISGPKGVTILNVADVTSPELINAFDLPGWSVGEIDLSNNVLYGAGLHGTHPDSVTYAGVIAVDISNPKSPKLKSEIDIANAGKIESIGPIKALGDYVYVIVSDPKLARLLVISERDGHLGVLNDVIVERSMDFESIRPAWWDARRDFARGSAEPLRSALLRAMPGDGPWIKGGQEPDFNLGMAIREGYLYVSSPSGIVIYDLSDPAELREVNRLRMDDAWANARLFKQRGIAIEGEKMYITSFFPRSLIEMDLSDPIHPVEQRRFMWGHWPSFTVAKGHAYSRYNAGKVWIKRLVSAPALKWVKGLSYPSEGTLQYAKLIADDQYMHTVIGNRYVIVPLAQN